MHPTLIDEPPNRSDLGPAGRVGLIALSSDMNIESELHRMLPPSVTLLTSRIQTMPEISKQSLGALESALVPAARSLVPDSRLDMLVYGCTSGAIVLGERRVHDLLLSARPEASMLTPSSAVDRGLRSLRVNRLSILAPYTEELTVLVADDFARRGYDISGARCFGLRADEDMAAVSGKAWVRAASLAFEPSADALFISCTSIQASTAIDEIEADIGAPVVCSNQALAWAIGNELGISGSIAIQGRLAKKDDITVRCSA